MYVIVEIDVVLNDLETGPPRPFLERCFLACPHPFDGNVFGAAIVHPLCEPFFCTGSDYPLNPSVKDAIHVHFGRVAVHGTSCVSVTPAWLMPDERIVPVFPDFPPRAPPIPAVRWFHRLILIAIID